MNRKPRFLGWYVYVMLTETADAKGHFKVGISMKLHERVRAIQTGCPFPLKGVLFVNVATRISALFIERGLHAALKNYSTSGEWFLFDLKNEAHKQSFKVATKAVIGGELGPDWKWRRLSIADLRESAPAKQAKNADKRVDMRHLYRRAVRGGSHCL